MQVTADNIERARELVTSCDIRDRLTVGCEVWAADGGWMIRWPDNSGGVNWGGDTSWGDWYSDVLVLHETGAHIMGRQDTEEE